MNILFKVKVIAEIDESLNKMHREKTGLSQNVFHMVCLLSHRTQRKSDVFVF